MASSTYLAQVMALGAPLIQLHLQVKHNTEYSCSHEWASKPSYHLRLLLILAKTALSWLGSPPFSMLCYQQLLWFVQKLVTKICKVQIIYKTPLHTSLDSHIKWGFWWIKVYLKLSENLIECRVSMGSVTEGRGLETLLSPWEDLLRVAFHLPLPNPAAQTVSGWTPTGDVK